MFFGDPTFVDAPEKVPTSRRFHTGGLETMIDALCERPSPPRLFDTKLQPKINIFWNSVTSRLDFVGSGGVHRRG